MGGYSLIVLDYFLRFYDWMEGIVVDLKEM